MPDDAGSGGLVLLLASSVGLPMVALAATAPLVQTWFAAENPDASPYRLYAASNLGSVTSVQVIPRPHDDLSKLGSWIG